MDEIKLKVFLFMYNEIIIKYFKEKSSMSKQSVSQLMKRFENEINSQVITYLNNILEKTPEYENIKNIVFHIVFNDNLKVCKTCGKLMKYSKRKFDFCSNKCIGLNKEIQLKKLNTLENHFGTSDKSQISEIKEKIKQTCLKKYGTECVLSNVKIRKQIKQTNLEKYGCEYPMQNKLVKEKSKQVCLEKYGVDNYAKTNQCKNKVKNTCLEKFGKSSYLKTEENRKILKEYFNLNKEILSQKRKETCLKKYNVENPLLNKDIQEKIKQTNLEKYNVQYFSQTNQHKEKVKTTNLKKYGKIHKNIIKSWNHINSLTYVKPLFTFEEFQRWKPN